MPWSTELRTTCVSGSLIASMIVLSRSVSLPSISIRTCLPQHLGEVADDARELAPDVADRLHARLHDAFLQLGGDQVQALRRAGEGEVALGGGELENLVAGQHQFADQVHQLVEQADIDAQRGVGDAAAALLVGAAVLTAAYFCGGEVLGVGRRRRNGGGDGAETGGRRARRRRNYRRGQPRRAPGQRRN